MARTDPLGTPGSHACVRFVCMYVFDLIWALWLIRWGSSGRVMRPAS
jgi:hypothetical protein